MVPTIYPSQRQALEAQHTYLERVKTSLISLLRSYAFATCEAGAASDAVIQRILELERPLPEFFFSHDRLQQAMRRQHLPVSRAHVRRILNMVQKFEAPFPYLEIGTALERDDEWEDCARREAELMTQRDFGRASVFKAVPDRTLANNVACIAAALSQLASVFPEMHAEFSVHVRCIRLFDGAVTMGFTDERMFGAMLLRIPASHVDPVFYYIEHIVHETSHMHLNALMAKERIVLNDSTERFESPIRPDPRPMIGVFHAAFVTSRIVQALLKSLRCTGNTSLLPPLAESADELIRGHREISRFGSISDYGMPILREMGEQISSVIRLPEWADFDFDRPRQHRYGTGVAHLETVKECVERAEPA